MIDLDAVVAELAWLDPPPVYVGGAVVLRSNSRLCSEGLKVTWRIPFGLLPQSPYALERVEAVFSEENGPNSKWLPLLDSNQRHSD